MECLHNVCVLLIDRPTGKMTIRCDTRLTGLLSFMLSDEMTTGSVNSNDADKRAYAARSHAWNIAQKRFKEAFPDYCTPAMRNLPNMGEKERGPAPSTATPPAPSIAPPHASTATVSSPMLPTSSTMTDPMAVTRAPTSTSSTNGEAAAHARGWADTWRQVIWEKWRWGVILALAVVVSRISSR